MLSYMCRGDLSLSLLDFRDLFQIQFESYFQSLRCVPAGVRRLLTVRIFHTSLPFSFTLLNSIVDLASFVARPTSHAARPYMTARTTATTRYRLSSSNSWSDRPLSSHSAFGDFDYYSPTTATERKTAYPILKILSRCLRATGVHYRSIVLAYVDPPFRAATYWDMPFLPFDRLSYTA